MTAGTFFFLAVGVIYTTSLLFKLIDIIEREPRKQCR